ncbi:hypothetical protein HMPREF0091_10315 [Fannyhessea vaginae DSM 15829]|uniref:Uncharacterized protein n=1 Tax=Fannyhessea vaginae DSM 15829 TaxID=525256 RepID=F1T3S4_9ACTN|nr:hypothetical protein HMPREF0091_10315 [Fannyhessea vaginae DSM 15829]
MSECVILYAFLRALYLKLHNASSQHDIAAQCYSAPSQHTR